MNCRRWSAIDCPNDRGHVLLGAVMLLVVISLLSITALYLAAQDVPGITAVREESIAQELADAAGDLVVGWFHDSTTAPSPVAGLLAKRQGDLESGPSFFDAAGRSQFTGTADRPDILLDAASPTDDLYLNNAPSGFGGALLGLGRLDRMKVYAPSQPGLLGTLEVTTSTIGPRPLAKTIRFQLGALNIPAIRAAVQIGLSLGAVKPGGEAPVFAHWGDVRVNGDVTIDKLEHIVVKSDSAAVTGQTYESMERFEDRWTDYWVGGSLSLISPPSTTPQAIPANVHLGQQPVPGVRFDRWDYHQLKKAALDYGVYYRLDRNGRLHPPGVISSDPGLSPSEVLKSEAVGQSQGLIFIDTVDGEAPRPDNLGTLVLDADYFEALLVVQGHVLLRPGATGRSVPVLSPSPEGLSSLGSRIPVTLSGIHLNGVLYSAGTITVERPVRIYGAVMTPESVIASSSGVDMEVWYNADLGRGYFRGLPVVYRAPGTLRLIY